MNTEILGVIVQIILMLAISYPLGKYISKVYKGEKSLLDFMKPLENLMFRLSGINPSNEMNWKQFLKALLSINFFWFFWGMVDLDNDPTKLIEIVEIGKQLLMTRGTLTTFSIANDVAKYFAIVPALFMVSIPQLAALNVMQLHSPASAILSAIIFNALIIPILIPLALKGVSYKPIGASALLRRNLLIYGLGGVIVPFIGIKLIDLFIGLFF